MPCHADALAKNDMGSEETTRHKRTTLFAGFGARTGNERLPKRGAFGEVRGGGKGCTREGKNTGLGGFSRKQYIVVHVVNASRALDAGSQEIEQIVAGVSMKQQMHSMTLLRYGEGRK